MRGRSIVVWSLSLVSCLASASAASAGHPQERHGFWISFGGGVGSANVRCDDCEGGREISGVGSLRLGGTLNDRLLLGGEIDFWSKEQEGITVNLSNILATLTVYPQPSSGFFLKAGAGVSFTDSEVHDFARFLTLDLGTGVGLLAGAGYDARVRRNVSITPAVSFWYGRRGGGLLGELVGNWSHNVVDFTVGITFH
jgi:hypothetical protein